MEKETDLSLDSQVDREIEELRLAGRMYRFVPEPKCRVCKQEESGVLTLVNKLLATGEPYTSVLQDISPLNDQLDEQDKISYMSIRNHHKKHFNTDNAAVAVYRRILERNAAEADIDFIGGVKNAVTPLAYLETVMQKGYKEITTFEGNVSPELGMDAALHLYKLTQESPEDNLNDLVYKTNRLIEIVREVVPAKYWSEIVERIELEEDKDDEKNDNIVDAEFEEEEV